MENVAVTVVVLLHLLRTAEIPVVRTWPSTQTFTTGSTVNIACTAVAYPPPSYAWRYGDSGQMVEHSAQRAQDIGRGDIPVCNNRDNANYFCQY